MEQVALAGVGLGLTAIGLVGGFIAIFSRSFLGAGRTLGNIEADVKATKVDVLELKTTVKDGQDRNDADHNKIFSKVNEHGTELANIQGYLNGKDAKNQVRKRRTKKKAE